MGRHEFHSFSHRWSLLLLKFSDYTETLVCFYPLLFFFLFTATHVAYGGSQARSQNGAAATGHATATAIRDLSRI